MINCKNSLMKKSYYLITFLIILISLKSFSEIVLLINTNSVTNLKFIGQI